jgi:hypothetical protein
MAIRKSSNSGIPFGNTAGRPASAATGQPYFNGEVGRLELYTSISGWQNIVQETPGLSSISGNYLESSNSGTIVISGTNFASGCYASAIGSNGVEVNASSTTFNSVVQVTAVFTGLSSTYEPYDIKITNPSNLFGIIPDILYVNNTPVWQTSAGSLGTFNEQVSVSVSATATDSDSTITYSLASGSSLPSGLTLNSSTGLISGTLPDISSDTTYTFTINASDGVNTVVPRTFSITSRADISVEILVVAGGGAGGTNAGAGGGAGGLYYSSSRVLTRGVTYSTLVGSGGSSPGSNGSNSTFSLSGTALITALGGGGGTNDNGAGSSGGSGGGSSAQYSGGSGNQSTSSSGGYGNPGGNGNGADGGNRSGAGGGGAGAAGQNTPSNNQGGAGGVGREYSITGTSTYYAGGGGGAPHLGSAGAGGLGGGGAGGNGGYTNNTSTDGNPGTANTGGGGGAGGGGGKLGASGGSGVIIIAYPNTIAAATVTGTYDQPSRSGYRVYRFTAGSGTITI